MKNLQEEITRLHQSAKPEEIKRFIDEASKESEESKIKKFGLMGWLTRKQEKKEMENNY